MRLHLVDGTFELYRAEYSKRPRKLSPDGRDVTATFGVMDSLTALLCDSKEKVTHIAAAFDNPIRSFRNDLFDGYKSDDGVPEELRTQFDLVEEGARAIGVTVWSMNKFEADDALATAAAKFSGKCEEIRICTPDKDLGQCVRGKKVVQLDRIRDRLLTEDEVTALRGVPVRLIPDFLALVGDDADGIPGLKGFGAKGAAAVIAQFGPLEKFPKDPAKWDIPVRGAQSLAQTFCENREAAFLYRTLATLREDVPLKETLQELAFKKPSAALGEFCGRLGQRDNFSARLLARAS